MESIAHISVDLLPSNNELHIIGGITFILQKDINMKAIVNKSIQLGDFERNQTKELLKL